MKKYLLILFSLFLLISCKNEQAIRISGNYAEGKGRKVYLELFSMTDIVPLDSARVGRTGNFNFTLELEHPELLLISDDKKNRINLIAGPGDEIEVRIPDTLFSENYSVSGSVPSEQIRMLVKRIENTRFRLDSIERALSAFEDEDDPRVSVLLSAYQQVINRQKKESIRFIIENTGSLASVYAIYQRVRPDQYVFDDFRDLQYMKIVSDSAGARYPGSSLVQALAEEVRNREQQYRTIQTLSQAQSGQVKVSGNIELAIQDPDNQVKRLSSLQGKVVLLNFWASRNPASIDANRNLKSIYDHYRERGFEVYSVSLDNNASDWLDAIRFEEYQWIDVCELTYPDSYAASSYNVQSLPANFLINREGDIIARNISGKVLTTWLDNLLENE